MKDEATLEHEAHACLDMLTLILYVTDDTPKGVATAIAAPIFPSSEGAAGTTSRWADGNETISASGALGSLKK